jgi:hypothetical protein
MLVVLAVASLAPGAPKKDKDQGQEFTHTFQHTYDEVFQATQEAFERLGYSVTDKEKGTISGNGVIPGGTTLRCTFAIHIEALNTKPETRVTMNIKSGKTGWLTSRSGVEQEFDQRLSSEIQKVLASYH